MIDPATNMYVGWLSMLAGALSGTAMGNFIHKEEWLGGYSSFRRRFVRLAHVCFFALGFINIFFALNVRPLNLEGAFLNVASISFIIGAITMPLFLLLTAWQPRVRLFLTIPILSVIVGISAVLLGM